LGDLSVDVDRSAVDQERQEVQATALRLRTSEQELNVERASQLYDEVRSLNSDRLTLLYRLSYSKRSAITGFTSTGIDQAAAELKQVTLVLKYHYYATLWCDNRH
jgi:predicted PhzF superfamily epimerase YddE/YHI9